MPARRPTTLVAIAAASLLAGCGGGSSDAWRGQAERACAAADARASSAAREGGRPGLAHAGSELVTLAGGLRRLDGPDRLESLAASTAAAGRALRAYARTGAPRRLAAARTSEARALQQARTLGLRACG